MSEPTPIVDQDYIVIGWVCNVCARELTEVVYKDEELRPPDCCGFQMTLCERKT